VDDRRPRRQGIGAAIVAPSSLALITAHFEGQQRSRAIAWYGATAGIGASLGLLVGGALTDWISWRAAFLVNVPMAAAMVVGARAVLVETPRRAGRFDAPGPCWRRSGWVRWCSRPSRPWRSAGDQSGWSPPSSWAGSSLWAWS
jgi:MFS family permease